MVHTHIIIWSVIGYSYLWPVAVLFEWQLIVSFLNIAEMNFEVISTQTIKVLTAKYIIWASACILDPVHAYGSCLTHCQGANITRRREGNSYTLLVRIAVILEKWKRFHPDGNKFSVLFHPVHRDVSNFHQIRMKMCKVILLFVCCCI